MLAPMAGVSDAVHRKLCIRYGAALATTEMVASDTKLWATEKSSHRMQRCAEDKTPYSVQIVGYDPAMLAQAAAAQEQLGAQIIDINMGCPAKKVCSKAAGSALMRDEALVEQILQSVVNAVAVPVTLKIRTGWSPDERNGVTIAKIAEQNGIQALTVHGRTRACRFGGHAEYDTIANIKQAINIPLIANGDITSGEKARFVLEHTQADALMIGRASQGNPFIFREIGQHLTTGQSTTTSVSERCAIAAEHLTGIHELYGEQRGYRVARKHIGWYFSSDQHKNFRDTFNRLESCAEQVQFLQQYTKTDSEQAA